MSLTYQQGLDIQNQGLIIWRRALNDEAYNALVSYITQCNLITDQYPNKTGYDVVRGEDLNTFIRNWAIYGNDTDWLVPKPYIE